MSISPDPTAITMSSAPRAITAPSPAHVVPPYATPLGSAFAQQAGIPWMRYLAAIWRYKWMVLGLVVLGAAAGTAAARRVRPTYEAHATLWIATDPRADASFGHTGELVNNSSWIDLLRSYTILERAAKRAGMFVQPASSADRDLFTEFALRDTSRSGGFLLRIDDAGARYTLSTQAGVPIETGTVGDSIGRAIGFLWQPAAEQLPARSVHTFAVRSLRDAANDLSSRLTTVQPDNTSFIRLTLQGGDPVSTANALNIITDEFINTSTELKKRSVVAQSATLRDQARAAQAALANAEAALARFRVSAATLPSDGAATQRNTSGPILNQYLDARIELDALQRDRSMLQDADARLRASTSASTNANSNAIDYVLALPTLVTRAPEVRAAVIALAAKDSALRVARQQYTDEHTTVRDLQAQVSALRLTSIPQLIAARLDQMARRQQDLEATIGSSAEALQGIPPRTLEELRLRRNVTLAENLFGKVENEYESAQLAEAGMIGDVSVFDRAVASEQSGSKRAIKAAALFTMLGGFGGLGLALLLDATDKRLRYHDQVRDDLDLWVLGTVPRLRARKGATSIQSAQLVESLRSIRVSVAYALGAQAPVQLAITSPNVGDGKSLVASNLAISFAEAGYRTLLVDGDIRRGSLHAMFGAARRPGLLDCLATGLALSDALVDTGIPNLTLLPCGTRYRQGPEILAGPGLSRLMHEAKSSYDVVLVDTPPLGVGSDAMWESVATGSLAIVLRLNASDRKLTKAKLEMLERLPVQVLGTVLNDCPTPKQDEYTHYLSHDTVDVDTAIPQRASQIGLIGSGTR